MVCPLYRGCPLLRGSNRIILIGRDKFGDLVLSIVERYLIQCPFLGGSSLRGSTVLLCQPPIFNSNHLCTVLPFLLTCHTYFLPIYIAYAKIHSLNSPPMYVSSLCPSLQYIPRALAGLVVFILSAFMHDFIIGVSMGFFLPVFLIMFALIGGLFVLFLTTKS